MSWGLPQGQQEKPEGAGEYLASFEGPLAKSESLGETPFVLEWDRAGHGLPSTTN